MSRIRLLAACCFGLTATGVATSNADNSDPPTSAAKDQAAPAVVIVPLLEESGGRPRRWVEVIEPGGRIPPSVGDRVRALESDAERTASQPKSDSAPRLLATFVPDPLLPQLRYCVFLDLSDPTAVRNWREMERARRRESRLAHAEQRSIRQWEGRKQRLLSAHEQATQEGVRQLRAGNYRSAIIALTRAAALNQGDPACRVYLALARVAVGHDAEAGAMLRAALELQPKLAAMELDLPTYFPSPTEYDAAVDALAARLMARAAVAPEEHLLLGFLEFQRGRLDAAHAAFQRAAPDMPRSEALQICLSVTKPSGR